MTWLQRYRLRDFVRNSAWLPPLAGLVAALATNRLMGWADGLLGWHARVGVEGSRIVLTALASSMFTFIVFVFSILLLAVQLASAQLTPRFIAQFFRNRTLKVSLSVFVFVFTFDLALLARIDDFVPQLSVWFAKYASVAAIGIFLYMIDSVGKSLRPVTILTAIGRQGHDVIERSADSARSPAGAPCHAGDDVRSSRIPARLAFVRRSAPWRGEAADRVVPRSATSSREALFRVYGAGGAVEGRPSGTTAIGRGARRAGPGLRVAHRRRRRQGPVPRSTTRRPPSRHRPAAPPLAPLSGPRHGRVRDAGGQLLLLPHAELGRPGRPRGDGIGYGKDSIKSRRLRAMLESLIPVRRGAGRAPARELTSSAAVWATSRTSRIVRADRAIRSDSAERRKSAYPAREFRTVLR